MIAKQTILFIIIILLNSCLFSHKCEFKGSYPISKFLFIERYKTFDAGVWGENTDCYITDSISFRTKIGSYDEHEGLVVTQSGDNIEVYNFESSYFPDTLETKMISKKELYKHSYSNASCLNEIPVFGKNSLKCSDFRDYYSHMTDDGYYISEDQYRCEKDFVNAVFFTDSSKFRILIGIHDPGSHLNNFSVKLKANDNFEFYNVEQKRKVDTVKHKTYLLSQLNKKGLITVCK